MSRTFHNPQQGFSLTLDGTPKRHGIVSLTTAPSHPNAVREPYFLLNVYRVLADGKLWTVARDEPFTVEPRENGQILHWQPTATLPVEMRAAYQVQDDDSLTLELWVRAAADLARFEISVSSYFDFAYEPYGVIDLDVQDGSHQKQPALWKAEDQPFVRGHYIHLSRDDQGTMTRMDGRWNNEAGQCIAPAVYGPHYGQPAAVMAASFEGEPITIVQSAQRESCDGISLTYSSENTSDNIRNHNALYFSLFGEDLSSGDERTAVLRQSVLREVPGIENVLRAAGH